MSDDWLDATALRARGVPASLVRRLPRTHFGAGRRPVWHAAEIDDLLALVRGARR